MLTCKYCETTTNSKGEPFSQGALNLHQYHCKNKQMRNNGGEFKGETCTHEYRFLNPKVQIERKAVDAGFAKVCNNCLTLQN